MAALTADRNTPERGVRLASHPVAAGKVIRAGSIVCLDADGNATPGATATTLKGAGRAEETIDNASGAAGAVSVTVKHGIFRWDNDGTVTRAHITGSAYAVDDQTIAPDSGTSTRSAIGIIEDIDDAGVWVRI